MATQSLLFQMFQRFKTQTLDVSLVLWTLLTAVVCCFQRSLHELGFTSDFMLELTLVMVILTECVCQCANNLQTNLLYCRIGRRSRLQCHQNY